MPDIDVDDWERNTEYSSGYDEDTQVVKVTIVTMHDLTQSAVDVSYYNVIRLY